MDSTDNPYAVLGVPESASAREIRSAYRRLALEHHPDRNPSSSTDTNTKLFAKINHAYEVLTDPDTRRSWQQSSNKGSPPSSSPVDTWPPPQYYDPFSVFESVFRDEFDRDFFPSSRGAGIDRRGMFRDHHGRDPFDHPFFRRGHQDIHRRSPFASNGDDIFSGFFGGFGGGFDDMLRSTLDEVKQQRKNENSGQMASSSSFYTSSSLSRRNSQGLWVTETTRNENGHVTTERITRNVDGTIVHQETIGTNPPCGSPNLQLPADGETTATTKRSNTNNNSSLFRLPWSRRGDDS